MEFFCELGEKKLDRGRKRTALVCTSCGGSVKNSTQRLHNKKTIIAIESFLPVRIRPGVLRVGSAYCSSSTAAAVPLPRWGRLLVCVRGCTNSPGVSCSAGLYRPHPPLRRSPFPGGEGYGLVSGGYTFICSALFRGFSGGW